MIKDKIPKNLKEIEDKIKQSFSSLREEMDEHRESINENTKEIEGAYKYMFEMEEKIEKLNERIDELCMHLEKKNAYEDFKLQSNLSIREQEVFLVLYTRTSEEGPLSYRQVARKLGLTESIVREIITGLIGKGIPVLKKYVNNETFLDLDMSFKQVQAKKNIVKINENLTRELVE